MSCGRPIRTPKFNAKVQRRRAWGDDFSLPWLMRLMESNFHRRGQACGFMRYFSQCLEHDFRTDFRIEKIRTSGLQLYTPWAKIWICNVRLWRGQEQDLAHVSFGLATFFNSRGWSSVYCLQTNHVINASFIRQNVWKIGQELVQIPFSMTFSYMFPGRKSCFQGPWWSWRHSRHRCRLRWTLHWPGLVGTSEVSRVNISGQNLVENLRICFSIYLYLWK